MNPVGVLWSVDWISGVRSLIVLWRTDGIEYCSQEIISPESVDERSSESDPRRETSDGFLIFLFD